VSNDHQVICGDCLDIVSALEPGSVDLVFCSPPYEAQRTYGIGFDLKGGAWVQWAADRFEACYMASAGLTAWVVAGHTRDFRWSASPALLMAELHRRGVSLRNPPIMHRVGVPGSGGPDWLRSDYEWIICAASGRMPWSDNTAMGHPPKWAPGGEMSNRLSDGQRRNQWGHSGKGKAERRKDGSRGNAVRPSHVVAPKVAACRAGDVAAKLHTKNVGDRMVEQAYTPPVMANPGNVIKVKVGGGLMGSKLAHENEAPFPEDIAEWFIRSFCPPGGLVLDPFSGSGTTAKVAKKLGRRSLSIDIRQSQCELTRRRLLEVPDEEAVA
jgi:hypothetical protein